MAETDKRTVLAIVTCTAAGAFGLASFTFAFPAVSSDFDLTLAARSLALKVPLVATLLVIFLAGSLSDRLGRRRVAVAGGLLYCIGAGVIAASPGIVTVVIGRVFEGAGSATLLIGAVAVTRSAFADERKRSVVYGTQTATTPAIYLIAPILGALVASEFSWRAVPALWLVFGGLATLAAWRFFPESEESSDHRPELLTPSLAGLVLAGVTGAAVAVETSTFAVWALLGLALVAGIALGIALIKERRPSLDLSPLKLGGFRWALLAAALPVAASFFFFTTLLFEYHFDYGLVATAALMAPASALSVAAGFLGGRVMATRGATFTAVLGLSIAGLSGLATFLVSPGPPAWAPALIVCGYAAGDTMAIVALTANVLNRVKGSSAGAGSSLRKAATGLGATVGSLVAAFFIWSAYEHEVATSVDETTIVNEKDAREFAAGVRDGEGSELLAQRLAVNYNSVRPLIDRREEILAEAEIIGYRTAGLVLTVIYGLTVALLLYSRRRYPVD